jgi:hypothetical protein
MGRRYCDVQLEETDMSKGVVRNSPPEGSTELDLRELKADETRLVGGGGGSGFDPPPPTTPPVDLGPKKSWVPYIAPTQDYGDANRGFYDLYVFYGRALGLEREFAHFPHPQGGLHFA